MFHFSLEYLFLFSLLSVFPSAHLFNCTFPSLSSIFSFTYYLTSIHAIISSSIHFPPYSFHLLTTQPVIPLPSVCRCLEEEGSLLDLEALPNFPKSLEGLRKAASGEQSFDVKDLFNTSIESETLKETLYRQAKTQVCGWSSDGGTPDGRGRDGVHDYN